VGSTQGISNGCKIILKRLPEGDHDIYIAWSTPHLNL